jgi:hypothetical protein
MPTQRYAGVTCTLDLLLWRRLKPHSLKHRIASVLLIISICLPQIWSRLSFRCRKLAATCRLYLRQSVACHDWSTAGLLRVGRAALQVVRPSWWYRDFVRTRSTIRIPSRGSTRTASSLLRHLVDGIVTKQTGGGMLRLGKGGRVMSYHHKRGFLLLSLDAVALYLLADRRNVDREISRQVAQMVVQHIC